MVSYRTMVLKDSRTIYLNAKYTYTTIQIELINKIQHILNDNIIKDFNN